MRIPAAHSPESFILLTYSVAPPNLLGSLDLGINVARFRRSAVLNLLMRPTSQNLVCALPESNPVLYKYRIKLHLGS